LGNSFAPNLLVRHTQMQTLLGRISPKHIQAVQQYEHPILLDGGRDMTGADPTNSVRLLGYHTVNPHCSKPDMTYVVSTCGIMDPGCTLTPIV